MKRDPEQALSPWYSPGWRVDERRRSQCAVVDDPDDAVLLRDDHVATVGSSNRSPSASSSRIPRFANKVAEGDIVVQDVHGRRRLAAQRRPGRIAERDREVLVTSALESFKIGTEMVWIAAPAAKVRTPVELVKSEPATAVPLLVVNTTEAGAARLPLR